MKVSGLSRYSLCLSIGMAMLAGCGGSQPPIGAPGTVSRSVTRSASYQQVYRFHPPRNGRNPTGGLLDVNGTLYGTTTAAGKVAKGTFFSVSPNGLHKVLYRFRGLPDGKDPQSGLLDVNGTLYGTTKYGGASECRNPSGAGCGTVFSITTSGSEKVLYAFKGGASDGAYPVAGLIDVNGALYGTTDYGASSVTSPCYGTGGVTDAEPFSA
ncbi:MAG: choice-of-anchor tandem repeat GloVer-containing protein [Candidatus Cybelea sp.]